MVRSTTKTTRQENKFFQTNLGYDWWLISCIVLLNIIGLAFLASSLSIQPPDVFRSEFLKQLLLGGGIGGVICFFLARTDYHLLLKQSRWFLIVNFILLGFLAIFALYAHLLSIGGLQSASLSAKLYVVSQAQFLPIKPYYANGAISWISFPVLPNFQPSEFTKLALLIFTAAHFLKIEGQKIGWLSLKKPFYAFLLSAFLIMLQPDLGTVFLIYVMLLAAYWAAGTPTKILTYTTLAFLAFGATMTLAASYRIDRVTSFLDPTNPSNGQVRNVQLAIEKGGWFGKGYGNSSSKQQVGVLYETSTDSIIAVIGEEIGFVGTIIFLSLYIVLLWRGMEAARNAPDVGGKLLATGISIWIVSQAFVNIMGMLSLLPLTGVPLPFVSKGGSAILMNLAAVGVLLNISRYSQKSNAKSFQFKGLSGFFRSSAVPTLARSTMRSSKIRNAKS